MSSSLLVTEMENATEENGIEGVEPHNVPVEIINMMHYGTYNGEEVLNREIELHNSK